jgi:hypothetical protein
MLRHDLAVTLTAALLAACGDATAPSDGAGDLNGSGAAGATDASDATHDSGGSAGAAGAAADAAAPLALERVARARVPLLLTDDESAAVAGHCQGATLGGGVHAVGQARPELAHLGVRQAGASMLDDGWLVYTLHEGRAGAAPVRSPDCQHRQLRFTFDRASGALAFGTATAPLAVPLDFLPGLPEPGASQPHDFCTARDLRVSHAVGGELAAAVTLSTGALAADGTCAPSGIEAQVVFATLALDDDGLASVAGTPYALPEGPGFTQCAGAQHWITDDIPTALLGAEPLWVTYCGALLDEAGTQPRSYLTLRGAAGSSEPVRATIPLHDPAGGLPIAGVWLETGGKQGSAIADGDARATFVYAAASGVQGSRLAWFGYDFAAGDWQRDPAGAVRAGWLGGESSEHFVEKYALGADRDADGRTFVAYLWERENEHCEGGGLEQTSCFKDDGGRLALRIVGADPDTSLLDELLVDADQPSDLDPELLTAPTHPDLVVRDGHLFLTYALDHYPRTGCGAGGAEPCRGRRDSVVSTSELEVWRILP